MRATSVAFALVMTASPALAAQSLARADSLLALNDTNGALAAYEAAVKKNLRDAEAHYRAGMLYMTRYVPGTKVSADRRAAEEHFRYATRFGPDSAKYWLGLAEVLRTESTVTTRVQIGKYVGRALEAARKRGGSEVARVAYRAALLDWEQYEQYGRRYLFFNPSSVTQLALEPFMDDWGYVERFFDIVVTPDPGDPGAALLAQTEEHLRAALSADPRYIDAAGLLVVALGEKERWPEAYELARALVRAAPDSGRSHALVGLTLARQQRWRQAQTTFRRALELMRPAERAPYDNLGLILKAADSISFGQIDPGRRAVLDSAYWIGSQPLFLSDVNEPRVEFLARLTYVIHRWTDPLRGYKGYESDRGAVYVRWGPPDIWANLGTERAQDATDFDRHTVAWVYKPSHLRFVFSIQPGYARAFFTGDIRTYHAEARDIAPVRFDNVPIVRSLDTIAVQVAQFRGDSGGKTDVAVFAAAPIGRMVGNAALANVQLTTAAIVKNAAFADVAREKKDEMIRAGDTLQMDRRSWRLGLRPDAYLLRVEAQLPALDRAARSSALLAVRPFTGDALMLSDVVVAQQVTPRDSSPASWSDFFIDPSGGRFLPGQPVALLWEVYNLAPDTTGIAHYRVDVRFTVQEIERRGFSLRIQGAIGDALGLTAKGDDRVTLSFAKEVAVRPGGRHPDYVLVDLENAQAATYLISVTVTDTKTGRTATAERPIVVSRTALQR